MKDFAQAIKRLVDELYPEAETIHLVLNNLNAHTEAVLYQAFESAEARQLVHKAR